MKTEKTAASANQRPQGGRFATSQSDQVPSPAGAGGQVSAVSEAHRIFADLRALRRSVLEAWQERAVTLTREEQECLRKEIEQTCQVLANLTLSS